MGAGTTVRSRGGADWLIGSTDGEPDVGSGDADAASDIGDVCSRGGGEALVVSVDGAVAALC